MEKNRKENGWEKKWYFRVFDKRRKWKEKLVRSCFLPAPTKNAISPILGET